MNNENGIVTYKLIIAFVIFGFIGLWLWIFIGLGRLLWSLA